MFLKMSLSSKNVYAISSCWGGVGGKPPLIKNLVPAHFVLKSIFLKTGQVFLGIEISRGQFPLRLSLGPAIVGEFDHVADTPLESLSIWNEVSFCSCLVCSP